MLRTALFPKDAGRRRSGHSGETFDVSGVEMEPQSRVSAENYETRKDSDGGMARGWADAARCRADAVPSFGERERILWIRDTARRPDEGG